MIRLHWVQTRGNVLCGHYYAYIELITSNDDLLVLKQTIDSQNVIRKLPIIRRPLDRRNWIPYWHLFLHGDHYSVIDFSLARGFLLSVCTWVSQLQRQNRSHHLIKIGEVGPKIPAHTVHEYHLFTLAGSFMETSSANKNMRRNSSTLHSPGKSADRTCQVERRVVVRRPSWSQ